MSTKTTTRASGNDTHLWVALVRQLRGSQGRNALVLHCSARSDVLGQHGKRISTITLLRALILEPKVGFMGRRVESPQTSNSGTGRKLTPAAAVIESTSIACTNMSFGGVPSGSGTERGGEESEELEVDISSAGKRSQGVTDKEQKGKAPAEDAGRDDLPYGNQTRRSVRATDGRGKRERKGGRSWMCGAEGEEVEGTEIAEADVSGRLESRVKERPARQCKEGAGSTRQSLSPKMDTALSATR